MPEALVPFFDALYYKYPISISRGYWQKYPIGAGLSSCEKKDQRKGLVEDTKWSHSEYHKMITENFLDPFDNELLSSLLTKYGLFSEKFFHKSIRTRVTRQFTEAKIDLQEFKRILSIAWGYEVNGIYNKWDAIYHIIDHIYEQTLSHAINNFEIYQQLTKWFEKYQIHRKCNICGKKFRVIDLPDWIYFGSNGCEICCFRCPIMALPIRDNLIELIPAFVRSCEFIPASSAGPINYSFTSRLSKDIWANVFLHYGKMGGIQHVKNVFGSWFKALAETGVLPNGVLVTARGIRCLAKDGHVCHSLDEQYIDEWFLAHGLAHEREPYYPVHQSLNPNGRIRADWKVHDTLIEYFGLVGDQKYERKMEDKILLAQYLKVNLIEIYPSDLENLDLRLACLLKT